MASLRGKLLPEPFIQTLGLERPELHAVVALRRLKGLHHDAIEITYSILLPQIYR